MKRIITGFIILVFVSNAFSQNIEWSQIAKLPKSMRGTAISWNYKIYFMEANNKISGVYEYSIIDDTWKKLKNMITPGWNLNLAVIDGIIYAIGGDPFRNRIESYDVHKNEWKKLKPMPTPRQHSNCCVVNGKIYVIGGLTSWTNNSDKNEMYDPKTNAWQSLSPLPVPFENPIIASVGTNIFALCGNILWMYDTLIDKWETKRNCPDWISTMFGCAVINNEIIIAGGQNKEEKAVSNVYIYNTTSNVWIKSTDLPKPRQLGGIVTINNKIYIIGGCDSDFNKYSDVYVGTFNK